MVGSTVEIVTRYQKKPGSSSPGTDDHEQYERPEDSDLELLGALA